MVLAILGLASGPAHAQPNILFIMGDDIGWMVKAGSHASD